MWIFSISHCALVRVSVCLCGCFCVCVFVRVQMRECFSNVNATMTDQPSNEGFPLWIGESVPSNQLVHEGALVFYGKMSHSGFQLHT